MYSYEGPVQPNPRGHVFLREPCTMYNLILAAICSYEGPVQPNPRGHLFLRVRVQPNPRGHVFLRGPSRT
jgi:hypothetical protein